MQRTTTETGEALVNADADTVERWMSDGQTVLIDVREDFEHAEESIPGAEPMPLSKLDPKAIRGRFADQRIVFHCRTGKRSADAANRFRIAEPSEQSIYHLAGGIEAWKSAGKPTLKPEGGSGSHIPIMRQVQIVAGSLVFLGVVLGVLVSEWFLVISGFVGAGLVFAGVSGWCGMAMLLGRMPWNKVKQK